MLCQESPGRPGKTSLIQGLRERALLSQIPHGARFLQRPTWGKYS